MSQMNSQNNWDGSLFSSTVAPNASIDDSIYQNNLHVDYNNKSLIYVDQLIIDQNSGFFANIYRFCQVVILLFSLFLTINYINAGRVWFLVILILSLLHLILSDFLILYFDEESVSPEATELNEAVLGFDREFVKLHIRVIAPVTHYCTVTLLFLLSVLYEIPATCIRTIGQCNLTVRGSVTLALNIAFSLVSLLILPQAYYSAWYSVEHLAVAQVRVVCVINAAVTASAVLLLCCIKFRASGGYSNANEAELARRRASVTFLFYIILFLTTMLATPWNSALFEFDPVYEILRVLGLFCQIASIPIYVKCYVFAELPFGWKKPLSPQGYTSPPGFDPGSLRETFKYAICMPIIRPRPRKPEKVEVLPDFDEIPMGNVYPQTGNNDPRTRKAPGQFLAPPRAQTYRV